MEPLVASNSTAPPRQIPRSRNDDCCHVTRASRPCLTHVDRGETPMLQPLNHPKMRPRRRNLKLLPHSPPPPLQIKPHCRRPRIAPQKSHTFLVRLDF